MPVNHNLTSSITTGQVRSLSLDECMARLASHRDGRLGYQTGRGYRSVVVIYTLLRDQIVFSLPDYNDIVHYAPGRFVTLEVEGTEFGTECFCSIGVSGIAQFAEPGDEPLKPDQPDETWPSGVCTRTLCLPMTKVEGTEWESGAWKQTCLSDLSPSIGPTLANT